MKKLIGILFLWSVLICSVHAEVIVLRSGKTIKGEILLNNDEVLILRQKDGSRFQFPKQEIISIDADAIQKSQSTTDTLVLNKVAFNLSVAGGATHTPNGWGGFVQPMLFIGANIAKNQPVFVGGSIGYNGVITRDNTYSWIPIQATLRCPIVRKKTGNNTMDGQPLISASIGYAIATSQEWEGGICFGVDAGWQKSLNNKVSFYIALTAQCLQTRIKTIETIHDNAYQNFRGCTLGSIGLCLGITL